MKVHYSDREKRKVEVWESACLLFRLQQIDLSRFERGNIIVKRSFQKRVLSDGSVKVYEYHYENIDILLVEDIVDSGRTLKALTENLSGRGAHSVRTVALLDKPSRRKIDFVPDYCGTEIPDEFVIGYGLDYDEKYRALPYVGVLRPEIYTEG